MIKIALCDDEQKILDAVTLRIREYAEKRQRTGLEVFACTSAKELEEAILQGSVFDIFVLDVYIGDALGTHLASLIRKRGIASPIIFLTTSLEHAPQSFETGTLRYLIKPLDVNKFDEAMDAALVQFEKMQGRRLKFKTENGVETISARQIVCSESRAHYQYIMLLDGSQLRVRMTVAELYALLSRHSGFLRVGSAYIVNLRNMKNVSSSVIHLYNDIIIPVPRGKYTEIKNAFWESQWETEE